MIALTRETSSINITSSFERINLRTIVTETRNNNIRQQVEEGLNINPASFNTNQNERVLEEEIELQSPPYYSEPNLLEDFQLLSHYTLRTDLDRGFYKVMMHGDNKLRETLKRVVIRTFCYRVLIILPILLGIVFGILYVYRDSNYFFAYTVTITLFFSFIFFTQSYYFIHYIKSVRDKETYMRLNRSLAVRLEQRERRRYNQEVERITYTLPPPTYHEASNLPPAYPS